MKLNWITRTVFLASLLMSACATINEPKLVTGRLARTQQFSGIFEVTPPRDSDWYEIQRTKTGLLAYGKKLESANHTFIASVRVFDNTRSFASANDFLAFIKQARANDNNPSRFSLLIHDESIDNTKLAYCTKFHLKAEDKVASKTSGTLSILESKGYSCLHPTKPHIITVEYSERGGAPFKNTALLVEGEAFINSLVLN